MIENVTYKKLGEVLTVERGGSPRPIQAYLTDAEDGLNWIKIGDAIPGSKYITSTKEKIKPEGLKKTRFVHKGDFILSNSMSFGRPYILGIDGCIHDGWLVLHDENNVFDKSYLYYYLSSPGILAEFKRLAVGGVVNNLNSELVRNVKVAILPLEDQQRIVRELDAIHAILDAKNAQLRELDNLAQAVFYSMFGDPIANEKGWEVKKIGDVFDILNGFAFKSSEYVSGGIRVIRIANVQKGAIVDDAPAFYPLSYEPELKRYMLHEDDLLMSLTGNVGRVGLLPKEMLPAALNQRVACLRLKNDGAILRYLYQYFNLDYFEQRCIESSRGIAQLNMSTEWLKEEFIPLPPLDLQQAFASKITAIEQQKELIRASIAETETLLAARMQHYFD